MAEGGSNEALLALQKYREYVAGRRDAVVAMWKNPPPPVMLAYGAVILTSGVLFSALGHWSKLKGFMWGSGLTAVMNLAVTGGSVMVPTEGRDKVGEVLGEMMVKVGLPESVKDEFDNLFLEAVQWELIYAVNGELSGPMRDQLALVLRMEGGEDERSRAIHEFLLAVGIDTFKSKKYVDTAVTEALRGTVTVFESRGYKVKQIVAGMV